MKWERIPQYPGYSVSDTGIVRRDRGNKALAQRPANGGLRVHIGGQTAMVHNLVLRAFTGRPPVKGYYPKHENGDRFDNRLDNLMWAGRPARGNK